METHITITESLRALLHGPAEPAGEGETGAEALALVAYRAALKGNDKYFKLIRDMTEGEEETEADVRFYFEGNEEYGK